MHNSEIVRPLKNLVNCNWAEWYVIVITILDIFIAHISATQGAYGAPLLPNITGTN